jgi:hypothetical protein
MHRTSKTQSVNCKIPQKWRDSVHELQRASKFYLEIELSVAMQGDFDNIYQLASISERILIKIQILIRFIKQFTKWLLE